MIIAKIDNFSLGYKSYVGDHSTTTHDIEICKHEDDYRFTIATFNEEGEIVSCENRLFENIYTEAELQAVKCLTKIATDILIHSENVMIDPWKRE